MITMVKHDHQYIHWEAHPLRVVGGRLPKGRGGNLRDDISILTVRWVKRTDPGQICIIPKPECFGHLGGRFPY